jgi:hypothetical protein
MANTTRRTAPPDSDLPASVADLRGQAKRRFPSVAGACAFAQIYPITDAADQIVGLYQRHAVSQPRPAIRRITAR